MGPGILRYADGGQFSTSGGTVTVPDNQTSHIMIDLQDNSIHAFPRSLHRGAVHIATVSAYGGSIISMDNINIPVIPKGRIEKTKRKLLRNNQIVRIALIGDSLTEGAGVQPFWRELVFDTAQLAKGLNITGLSHANMDNFAAGGQTSRYGAAIIGQAVSSDSSGPNYGNTAITYGAYAGARYLNPPVSLARSTLQTYQYDLAIVSWGANGGTNRLAFFENAVKELRKNGTEVILTSQNNMTTDLTFMYAESAIVAQMADAWGCEFADVWCYVREAELNGINCHSDTTHMNAAGHVMWAKAIRSVLNDRVQERESIDVTNVQRVITETDGTISTKFPNTCDVQFTPFNHSGTVTGGASTISTSNPALNFGGKTTANYVTRLTSGQFAWFAHAHAHAVDFLVGSESSFTADIKTENGGSTLGSISFTAPGNARIALVEGINIGAYTSVASPLPGYLNRGVQIVVTSGTCNLVGAVFHTWTTKEIPFSSIDYVGTWAEDTWSYSHPVSKYTDTDGDSLVFEFEGTGCQVLLSSKSAGGKVDVWLDGVQMYTQKDLYQGGTFLWPADLFPIAAATNHFDRGYGRHVVKIKLNGVNASAVVPATNNHRLQLLAAYVFDGR